MNPLTQFEQLVTVAMDSGGRRLIWHDRTDLNGVLVFLRLSESKRRFARNRLVLLHVVMMARRESFFMIRVYLSTSG